MVKEMVDGFGKVYEACEKNVGMEIICPECKDTVKCVKNYVCGFQDEDKHKCWKICKLKNKKKDFKASAKEYYKNLDSERQICLNTKKCNPKIYRQEYYTWTHNHSKEDYGDCSLRYSASNNLKRLKRMVANYFNMFDDWKDFIENDDTMVNDKVFCVTQKHFKNVFKEYGYEKKYVFNKIVFEGWKSKSFHKFFSKLNYGAFHFFDMKDGIISYYELINYAPNSDRFIFSISGKKKISRNEFK